MWSSSLILIVLDLLITTLDQLFLDQLYEFSITHWVVGIIINVLSVFLSVNILNIVKERSHNLSIFGYIWRTLVASNLALFSTAAFILVTGSKFEIPSLQYTFVASGIMFLFIPVLMWALFSSNRRAQFIWFGQIFRGVS